jgi:hypothetical protein
MMIRTMLVALALLFSAAPAMAQEANPAAIAEQKAAMKRFAWMLGTWRGPAKGMTRAGPYQVTQTERIGPMLDGTVVVIEGKGFRDDDSVAFNAFAIVSWDVPTKTYKMRSHALGYAGDFVLTPIENGYTWQIPAGPGATIDYKATFSNGIWTETGDYVAAGQPPRRIMEMNLKRVGDSDWPAGGGLSKD